jgi:hypothetical protein
MTNTHDCTAPANPAVTDIKAKWAADPSASKSRRQCMEIGGWGQTTQLEKEKRGVLRTYLNGASVRITSESLYRHLVELASVPIRKVRQPAARFQRKRRDPTPQELEALKRANAARKRAAAERRAKAAGAEAVNPAAQKAETVKPRVKPPARPLRYPRSTAVRRRDRSLESVD